MGIAYRYYDKVYVLSFCICHKENSNRIKSIHKDEHKNNEETGIKIGIR